MTLMSLMAVRFQNMIYFIFHWVTGFRALLFSQSYTISSQFFFPTSLWQTLHSLHFERLWAFSRFGCRSRSVRKTRLWLCWCALMLLWCFDRKYAPVSPPYTQSAVFDVFSKMTNLCCHIYLKVFLMTVEEPPAACLYDSLSFIFMLRSWTC